MRKDMITTYRLLAVGALLTLIVLLFSVSACVIKPSGTYTATGVLGIKSSVTFTGNTLEMQGPLGGKNVYKFEIRSNNTEIILTDPSTDKSTIHSYKYIKDPSGVVIDGTAYYK